MKDRFLVQIWMHFIVSCTSITIQQQQRSETHSTRKRRIFGTTDLRAEEERKDFDRYAYSDGLVILVPGCTHFDKVVPRTGRKMNLCIEPTVLTRDASSSCSARFSVRKEERK